MKLGDERSDEAMMLVAPEAFERGEFRFKHPRCGWLTLQRREYPEGQRQFRWVIIECEKPDP